ncbi:TniQ family protein [Pseudomonas sp. OTU5201]|uniref:TniQ family protein n=1 Tax=Pseudomonas sp. OTU5201 TaxID=3043850 RepID=UPI00313B71F3
MTLLVILTPAIQEALNGYFLRLAQANLVGSVADLLKAVGLSPRQAYTSAQLAIIAEEFGLDEQELAARNPAAGHLNPLLNLRFQRATKCPVCPQCLAEAPNLNQAWAHDLVTACPAHGVRLIDECPNCTEPVTLSRTGLNGCDGCGFALSDVPVVPADEAELAISALMASVEHGARGRLPGSLGTGAAPGSIGEFLTFLAAHVRADAPAKPRKAARPTSLGESRALIERLWSVLGHWPMALEQLVVTRLQEGGGPGLTKRLGSWYGMLHREFADSAYSFFRDALISIVVQHFDGHINLRLRTLSPEQQQGKSWLSSAEAARLLGVGDQILAAQVVNGAIPGRVHTVGSSRFVSLERSVVEQLDAARRAHLSATDARKRLGVSKVFFERFIQAGGLTRLAKVDRPVLVAGEYRLADVDTVIGQLHQQLRPRPIPVERSVGIQDISARRGVSNDRITGILQDILHGVISPVAVIAGMPGIAGLRFDWREIQARLINEWREPSLLITELVRLSGWKHECIKAWIAGGFLHTSQETRGRRQETVIPLSSLIQFMSRYAVLADLARRAGSKSNWILQSLKPAGIREALAPQTGTGARRGVLLSVDDLLSGAQLRQPLRFAEIVEAFCVKDEEPA